VARAAFPRGVLCLQLRDTLAALYTDEDCAELVPIRGQPAEAPWRLALVPVLQFVEGLPDRQAADAVRSRLDWKYALSLELSDPGFDHTVLSEFRTRLVQGGGEHRLLDVALNEAKARGWLKARGGQRTDSTHVLAAVRALNRLECVGETLRPALSAMRSLCWLRSPRTGCALTARRGAPSGSSARVAASRRIEAYRGVSPAHWQSRSPHLRRGSWGGRRGPPQCPRQCPRRGVRAGVAA
jgi:transposase